jgi:F-type H+-transporting ATPase subunit gamma
MISLRTLRRKIKSIKSIQQIFHAMKMISSVRLKRTKTAFDFSSLYSKDLKKAIAELQIMAKAKMDLSTLPKNIKPFVLSGSTEKICLVVITSDKGLCGSFNSNIVRAALDYVAKNSGKDIKVVSVGKKGKSALSKKVTLFKEFSNATTLKYSDAKPAIDELLAVYIKDGFTKLLIVHATFKSNISQPVVVTEFLPLSLEGFIEEKTSHPDFISEPEPEKLFFQSIPLYVKSELYKIIVESALSEHAARIFAMESAMKNSDELIGDLSLQLNKLRQERITAEISELTANIL